MNFIESSLFRFFFTPSHQYKISWKCDLDGVEGVEIVPAQLLSVVLLLMLPVTLMYVVYHVGTKYK